MNTEQEVSEGRQLGITRPIDVVPYAMVLPDLHRATFAEKFLSAFPQFRSKRIVLFLSRVHPKKGLDLLLDAFRKIHTEMPSAVLAIVGDGDPEYLTALKAQVHNLALGEAVQFVGFLSGEMKWAAMAAAELFVLPTQSENFGIAVIEAMSVGTPVVVTREAAVSSFVESAGGGATVERTPESLSRTILALLKDKSTLFQLGEAARRAAKLFSASEVATRTHQLYRRGLANDPKEREG
jgi:glycosyltransferase involved in cell wall biosynthesis